MKKRLLFWQVLFLLLQAPLALHANDYMELQKHYFVYVAGSDHIHAKIPVFVEGGREYDYHSTGSSYIYFKVDNAVHVIGYFQADCKDTNTDENGKGDLQFWMKNDAGTLIAKLYNGTTRMFSGDTGTWSEFLVVKQEEDDGYDQVTFFEFDWYMPPSLDKKQFNFGVQAEFERCYTGGGDYHYSKNWEWGPFDGAEAMITPMLHDPFIYTFDRDGKTGFGNAAVPYTVFYDTKSYHTSLNPGEIITDKRADNIIVPTTDTIQDGFYAVFTVDRDKTKPSMCNLKQTSTTVNIPPYHRIYDFSLSEEKDSTGTFTGNNIVSWRIKNPELKDLMDGDMFELQRALNHDFSDAKSIAVLSMTKKGEYKYVDESREIWSGHVDPRNTPGSKSVGVSVHRLPIYLNDTDCVGALAVFGRTEDYTLPAVPVYYRIRRASSSVWGWTHDFAHADTLYKHNFLAPLAAEQRPWTLDPEFETNRKVHFDIAIENRYIDPIEVNEDSVRVNFTNNVDFDLNEEYEKRKPKAFFQVEAMTMSDVRLRLVSPAQETLLDTIYGNAESAGLAYIEYGVYPTGSTVYFYYEDSAFNAQYNKGDTLRFELSTDTRLQFGWSSDNSLRYRLHQDVDLTKDWYKEHFMNDPAYSNVRQFLVDTMTSLLKAKVHEIYAVSDGHSMWDRTARLVLERTITETGQTNTYIIPQDSIRRQIDGSWRAHYTDVADLPCSNYSYSVRIDQSDCDLHFKDSASLQPIVLTGPSLYFDEAAQILSFTATQGDIVYKKGVLLKWQPSSHAVDDYALLRVAKGSDEAADTIYVGPETNYLDETAVPDKHYEYTVVARYECQTKHTENSATAEGWRTPYGEIHGMVLMPDNTGMSEVKVTLQKPDNSTIEKMTDGSGTFLFDSLLYDPETGSDYAVMPTAAYGTFSFNNTSSGTAAITLTKDNAVATGINFVNTSTTRLSGRVLYKLSTIPVPGAMFTLNGDTIRRMNGAPLTTGTDGNFEFEVTKGQPYVLQVFKPGHTFQGDGILQVEQGVDTFSLTKPLDGVRFYDQTKVRLTGRVAGGIDQQELPTAFGKGTNNLGEDLQLILQIEGDNTAHIVHDPDDLTRDTFTMTVPQIVYSTDPLSVQPEKQVGKTKVLFEKKRIIIQPDPETGEYVVDLFPVKYKVVQATAKGYSTLFATGSGNETFDLTNAPLTVTDRVIGKDSVHYNAVYDRIYRSPIKVQLKQIMYGLEQDGYGEPSLEFNGLNPLIRDKVELISKNEDATINYLLGYPVFYYGRKYQFEAQAYEDYYYNNDPVRGRLDRVPQRGGSVMVRNGMVSSTNRQSYPLNEEGKNRAIWLSVENLQTQVHGDEALSTVSVALTNSDGSVVETDAFRAYVAGDVIRKNELSSTEADITLFDIVRDPGGNGSSAWVESGSTYSYSYTESYDWEAGVELTPKYGMSVTTDVGVVSAPQGTGNYTGGTFSSSKQISFDLPITHEWSWGYKYSYSFTTNQKITSSSKKNKTGIGSNADVFFGATTSMLTGKAQTISLINDSLFAARKPALDAGMMRVLAQGKDTAGNGYHLVTGEKVVLGSVIANTFVYSQYYILETVIPQLALERQSRLMTFPDSTSAQNYANGLNEPVYWYLDSVTKVNLKMPLDGAYYKMLIPSGSKEVYTDRIAALNNMMRKWMLLIVMNEKEKVLARQSGKEVGTYSVSFGNSYSHSDSYSASAGYNELPQNWGLIGTDAASIGAGMGESFANAAVHIKDWLKKNKDGSFGTSAAKALERFYKDEAQTEQKSKTELGTVTTSSKVTMSINPVLSFDSNSRTSEDKTDKKSTGFTLIADDQGDITVSVYRASLDSVWKASTAEIRENVNQSDESELYGSYVFFTQAGATYCVHEQEEKTQFYNPGTILNNGTMMIAKPEISINTYEVSNVPADQRAKFIVELKNAGQEMYGFPSTGTSFSLSLTTDSNPYGAKVYMNGAPLVQGMSYFLTPGQVIRQVMEVERGEVDDYENLTLYFSVGDCVKTYTFLNFSVHFIPEAGPVEVASPRQNWVMNTLSPQDSIGYYLPIDITGFDIHYKNFDHIEFQYKLSSESDEAWVNQCSFYANDSLYERATGNKSMIVNGRIPPFRFYGERDPKEVDYDLRAVCFCRHGSGFVTKSSPVMSGTKDTRPPRVFGEPEPANAILSVGDQLKLRFNEPIAGNWLDEDNNFQIIGVTNETGITSGTSLHFDGKPESYAATKVNRNLSGRSLTIDMMVKPDAPRHDEVFFRYGEESNGLRFGITADNRLYLKSGNQTAYSKTFPDPLIAFTRVVAAYDAGKEEVRFFFGTEDYSSQQSAFSIQTATSSPLTFGQGFTGNMLEARIWTKALTAEEVVTTHLHYLTGYERELTAYYPMNEGRGEILTDKANGASLYTSGTSWTLRKGFSLRLNATDSVKLDGNLLGRNSAQDETVMFWFKTTSSSGPVFRAGTATWLGLQDGKIVLKSGDQSYMVNGQMVNDNEWHHLVLTINRSFNNAALYADGQLLRTIDADKVAAIRGAMYLGGKGFDGYIDELAFFEQALPKVLIEEYDNLAPMGDEMGLFGYLPFEEQKQNASGVLELVFSPNDQRVFKDPNGNEIKKVVPLVIGIQNTDRYADRIQNAPVRDHGKLTKLNFGWAYNNDELLININMQDREINKQSLYLTVRDVEDLHGNPMPSPVTWVAFADKSNLKWVENKLLITSYYNETSENNGIQSEPATATRYITNASGRRHQFTIESLPTWVTVSQEYGSIDPMAEKALHFTFSSQLPVGIYTDIVYLTDENGLSEPLYVEYEVQAFCPWPETLDDNMPYSMSLRGQVKIENEDGQAYYDSDEHDIIAAFCEGQIVGITTNTFTSQTNTSYVYLTIHGTQIMLGRPVSFKLWRASTGKIFNLTPSEPQTFANNAMRGISPNEPIELVASASMTQHLSLNKGWNWTSLNLQPTPDSRINTVFNAELGFREGDFIKSPAGMTFAQMSSSQGGYRWIGSLQTIKYAFMYMIYAQDDLLDVFVEGRPLSDEQRVITLSQGWNSISYMLEEPLSLREALADYYDHARVGDVVKSKNQFAVFTENNKWEGSLQTMRPGQGYLLRRVDPQPVTVHYYAAPKSNAPRRARSDLQEQIANSQFTNPEAASNMTMIAKVEGVPVTGYGLRVFVNDELAAVAEPLDSLYFITIQSDQVGELRFEMEDQVLTIVNNKQLDNQSSIVNRPIVNYEADAHYGSVKAPIILRKGDNRPYKIIENNHVIIIRNNEKYDVTGKKL